MTGKEIRARMSDERTGMECQIRERAIHNRDSSTGIEGCVML